MPGGGGIIRLNQTPNCACAFRAGKLDAPGVFGWSSRSHYQIRRLAMFCDKSKRSTALRWKPQLQRLQKTSPRGRARAVLPREVRRMGCPAQGHPLAQTCADCRSPPAPTCARIIPTGLLAVPWTRPCACTHRAAPPESPRRSFSHVRTWTTPPSCARGPLS